jgi:hypothetical protein
VSEWDEADDPAWLEAQREIVLDYLRRQNTEHGGVAEIPAWHISPYIAIWPVESLLAPGRPGWWAISGDLPTDYCSSARVRTPREAAQHFSETWLDAARDPREDGTLGTTGLPTELRDLLAGPAKLLAEYVEDDEIWLLAEDE